MRYKTEIVPNAKRKTGNGNDIEHRPNETEQNENVTVFLLCTVYVLLVLQNSVKTIVLNAVTIFEMKCKV